MRRALISSIVTLGLVLSACSDRAPHQAAGGTSQPAGSSPTPPERRYQASATVLQREGGPTMLCLGGILTSLPPQCGTVPITNWDWSRVQGESRASGTTWGVYHVVGTYDGDSFTVLDVTSAKSSADEPQSEIVIPCPEPAGGWVATDPGPTNEADLHAAGRLAGQQPDSAGWWIKHTEPPTNDDGFGPNDVVLNAAFTGDIERHRTELSQVWGGPLCVVRYERTQADLERIRSEMMNRGESDFGIQIIYSDVNVVHNEVQIGVVAADDRTQADVDARYGEGTVRLIPALHPAQ